MKDNVTESVGVNAEFYGIITGAKSETFAQAINQKMNNALITSTWKDIKEFHQSVNNKIKNEIAGITAIMVTDRAFSGETNVEANAFTFHFLQSMFKSKELYGIHLILYTKDQHLLDTLESKYREDPDAKYEGTRLLLCTGDYTVSSIIRVFKSPFALLSYSDKKKREMEKIIEMAEADENRRISNQGFIMLLGKQQALQEQIEYLQRELTVTGRRIVEYATAINDDNLDIIIDDIRDGTLDTLIEKYDKLR